MKELSKAINEFWDNISNIDKKKVNEEERLHKFDNANIDELWEKIKEHGNNINNYESVISLEQVNNCGILETEFFKLALSLIYSGHIEIKYNKETVYRIYINTVEFYFHSEGEYKDNKLNVKDPIMYHRNERLGIKNEKTGKKEIPYLPTMSLYAHNSGYDITFENGDLKYRASALIRAYTVENGENKIIKRESTQKGKQGKEELIANDQRSTYLYDILNGFSLLNDGNNSISWEPDPLNNSEKLIISPRTNVLVSKNPESYDDKEEFSEKDIKEKEKVFVKKQKSNKYNKRDLRPWQFSIWQEGEIWGKRNATNER